MKNKYHFFSSEPEFSSVKEVKDHLNDENLDNDRLFIYRLVGIVTTSKNIKYEEVE